MLILQVIRRQKFRLTGTLEQNCPLKSLAKLSSSTFNRDMLSGTSPLLQSPTSKTISENKVVVFDQTRMKTFLLGVWEQMNKQLGTISSLKKKLDDEDEDDVTPRGSVFKKKARKKNKFGVPVFEKVTCKKI